MPDLDVTDILFDPDFCDTSLVVKRRSMAVDDNGFGKNTVVSSPFAGVVTVDRSLESRLLAGGRVVHGAILIVTT